jgi:serine/threonine protein kinase
VTISPQTSLNDRYLLLRRLAFGGMGEVWEGSDVVLDRAVAVKILRAELADDDAFRRRFRAEARTAGRVPHPGIAAVYDYGETAVEGRSLAYLVMELVPGEALSAILAREGALGADRTLDIVAQAGRALHAAHERGVIHRDVKPANLMVTPDGRVKVTDFGIARPDDHEPLTATGQVMGTAHYLAPELARGRAATPASDIYALGVVAYECLAGRRPFEGDDQIGVATAHLSEEPPPLPETIAPDVRSLVGAAMEKDPQRRIGGADVLASAAESLRLRLRSPDAAINGSGAMTAFVLGAAEAKTAYSPSPFGPSPFAPPSGEGAAGPGTTPGAAASSGALLAGGAASPGLTTPGSGASGHPGVYQRPPTAPLPVLAEPVTGQLPGGPGRRGGRRSMSVPMIALLGLVTALVLGTAFVALRPGQSNEPGGQPATTSPKSTPTPHRTSKPSPSASRTTPGVVGGTTSSPVTTSPRPAASPTRTTRPAPSPSSRPSPSPSPSPAATPTPTAGETTTTSPAAPPTPSPTGVVAGTETGAATWLGRAGVALGGH